MNTNEMITTAQASRILGVSVATIKRWVDDGVLPAHKTAGGHRRLLVSDIQRLAKQNHFPQADLGLLTKQTEAKKPHDVNAQSRHLYRALLDADEARARAFVQCAVEASIDIETLGDRIICPALTRVGADWETGKIDVYQEHQATRICENVLVELRASLRATANRSAPVAIGGSAENDPTVICNLLIQMLLMENGWRAVNLGPHTPLTSLRKALDEYRPKMIWLSITHPLESNEVDRFIAEYQELYQRAEQIHAAVAVGGRGLTSDLRERMTYTMFGDGLTQLGAFARSLNPSYRRPKRGRPPVQ